MQAIPIPAFVAYDGLREGDLEPMEMYMQLNLLDGNDGWKIAARNLAKAAMVKLQSTDPKKAFVPELVKRIPPLAKRWAKEKFQKYFLEVRATAQAAQPFSPMAAQVKNGTTTSGTTVTTKGQREGSGENTRGNMEYDLWHA